MIKKFEDAAFFEFAVGHHEGKETIILRDSDKNEIDKYDDNTNVKRMRLQLTKYNKLLEKSFIDIQKYDVPRVQNSNGNPIIMASTISDHNESLNLYFTFLDINKPFT